MVGLSLVPGPHPTDSPLASDVFLMWKSWFFVMVADLTLKKRKGNLSSPYFPS